MGNDELACNIFKSALAIFLNQFQMQDWTCIVSVSEEDGMRFQLDPAQEHATFSIGDASKQSEIDLRRAAYKGALEILFCKLCLRLTDEGAMPWQRMSELKKVMAVLEAAYDDLQYHMAIQGIGHKINEIPQGE